ncbi:hypothetical protein ACQP2E_38505 [Actinoplanes sp. CA-015351]|uniref:hypothetical protein n=1 Tax=Actinoplanes sp. CA-015351 TaxID=3239897 RepID=UPI003D9A09B8
MDRPTGLPMVLILECRSHFDIGDLPNMLAAELGVMTVRLERAIRSLDGVARVHVNRWGDGSAHLHMWFLARPYGRLQLRGTFLSLWDDLLPVIPESQWRENLAHVAAWLADFGGKANAEPAHIQWESAGTFAVPTPTSTNPAAAPDTETDSTRRPQTLGDIEAASPAADSGVRITEASSDIPQRAAGPTFPQGHPASNIEPEPSSRPAPAPEVPAPAPEGQAPAPEGQAPAPEGQAPAPEGQAPAPEGQAPAPEGQAPAPEVPAAAAPPSQS